MAKTETARDHFYRIFCDAFLAWSEGAPYQRREADFVQLAKLEKTVAASSDPAWLTEARFARATANYFASRISGGPTLADLAARFSVFYKAPLDQFGRTTPATSTKPAAAPDNFDNIWCSEDCKAAFLGGRFACADCERRLRQRLGCG